MTEAGERSVVDLVRKLEGLYRGKLGLTGTVPLHAPSFGKEDREYVLDCIDTGWVSTAGSYVPRFEDAVRGHCGSRHAVSTVNGTAALHIALVSLGVGRDDLVITQPLTFVATANAIVYCGAEPVFCDVDADTLGLSASAVARFFERECRRSGEVCIHAPTGRRVSAIVPVHVFGHPVHMGPLLAVARDWGVPVIEDATEALGSRYMDKPCGSVGRIGVFSFNGNKICTTGGGGMIVTDDDVLGSRIRHLATTARIVEGWEFVHDEVGYNYRLPNLNAALGLAQMNRLQGFVEAKRRLWEFYAGLMHGLDGVELFAEPHAARSNYWLHAVLFPDRALRDLFLKESNGRDIQTRPCWRLMPDLTPYAKCICADGLSVARRMAARIVNIPSSPALAAELTA